MNPIKQPPSGVFITGTDTEIGKTVSSLALMQYWKQQGYKIQGMKPVAAGCERLEERPQQQRLRNTDALQLQYHSSQWFDYEIVNPYALLPPVAPHLAAAAAGITLDIGVIQQAYQQIQQQADCVVVEGTGGWRVPLGEKHGFPELVKALQIPVMLVVGLRLGCINHALLTAEVIQADGCQLLGWVANHLDETNQQVVIEAISQRIDVPLLGAVSYQEKQFTPQETS